MEAAKFRNIVEFDGMRGKVEKVNEHSVIEAAIDRDEAAPWQTGFVPVCGGAAFCACFIRFVWG
ncbi:hypothetical protein ACFOLA_02320 [Salinicoccus hispanicus]|uniref:Uncharacterized protein n=1 Tax=Salinicoccus hispanicus TaxID=157225 RepID=A0A6N8TWV0_9STAP|nr:hypothetical protein [Salinicoccus hispanicus]MXQ50418.1 hypothetical protein [Salinicoccus hispanicus]